MKSAPLPANESERLAALERYGILDTETEELFDSIAKIAATICDAPVALITLVDEKRQWFKAAVGLGIPETSRDVAFCAHAILEPNKLLIVPDSTKDERFHDNPLVTGEPKVRFYAGAPIVTSDQHALGSLCVIDYQPRKLSHRQQDALRKLSIQVCANLDLRIQAKRLQQLNETKNRLFSVISHDLRSPLYSMISLIELLSDDEGGFSEAEKAKFVQHLQNNAETTLQIAENLLKMAQFEEGKFHFAPKYLELDRIIENAKNTVASKLEGKGIKLSSSCPPNATVWADVAMLQSIVQNLLSNASKFTPNGGCIDISVTQNDDMQVVSVRDTGVGMKPGALQNLFKIEACYSTEGTDGEKGSGLGLTLCRQFARRLGGDLVIDSTFGQGTVATLTVPIEEPE